MLAVLAIATVALLVAIPSLSTWLRSNRVRTATNLVVTHMRVVRHAAINLSHDTSLDYDGAGDRYTYQNTEGDTVEQVMPEGVALSSASPDPLTFQPNGSLSGVSSASVQIEGPVAAGLAHRYTITVNNIGKISVTKQEVSL
jgi:Tfp pilus assembly protein FimT